MNYFSTIVLRQLGFEERKLFSEHPECYFRVPVKLSDNLNISSIQNLGPNLWVGLSYLFKKDCGSVLKTTFGWFTNSLSGNSALTRNGKTDRYFFDFKQIETECEKRIEQ